MTETRKPSTPTPPAQNVAPSQPSAQPKPQPKPEDILEDVMNRHAKAFKELHNR